MRPISEPDCDVALLMGRVALDVACSMVHGEVIGFDWLDLSGSAVVCPVIRGGNPSVSVSAPGESQDHSVSVSLEVASILISITALEYVFMSMWGSKKSALGYRVLDKKRALLSLLEGSDVEDLDTIYSLVA